MAPSRAGPIPLNRLSSCAGKKRDACSRPGGPRMEPSSSETPDLDLRQIPYETTLINLAPWTPEPAPRKMQQKEIRAEGEGGNIKAPRPARRRAQANSERFQTQ